MSLSSALSIAMSGLRANQAALSIVSGNVANANTPGYVAQTLVQDQIVTGSTGWGVRVIGVNRTLDTYVQSQLRTENAGGAYADQIASVLGQLQNVYGTPGQAGTLEAAYNNFTSALQALSASSGNQAAQSSVLNAAQALAQQLKPPPAASRRCAPTPSRICRCRSRRPTWRCSRSRRSIRSCKA